MFNVQISYFYLDFVARMNKYVISIGGTKSREKWYVLNINNQNINDQNNSIFTLTWFHGLKYRHADSCNQTKGKVVLSEI